MENLTIVTRTSVSFRSRLILLFGALFAVVLLATFLGVNWQQSKAATTAVRQDLEQDSIVFDRLVSVRSRHLLEAARLVGSDYAFLNAFYEGDQPTLESAMANYLARSDEADLMLLLSLDGEVLASTEPIVPTPQDQAEQSTVSDAWMELVYAAEDDDFGEAGAVIPSANDLLQAMVVPFGPDLEAWLAVGFRIDQDFVDEFKRLTRSEITLVRTLENGGWQGIARTVGAVSAQQLLEALEHGQGLQAVAAGEITTVKVDGTRLLTGFVPLVEQPEPVVAILQRSLEAELAPYNNVRRILILIFAAGLLLAIAGAAFAAGSVTRPVLAIAEAAIRIEKGELGQEVLTRRNDEIGRMAQSFNHMAKGLAEKERVRDLLGKVVSPAIAEELLGREINLGGEEREVTILFSDVRSFTNLCEGRSPTEILDFLNLYLTEVSSAISARGGVVDKFIGDAVMALFGAPVEHDNDPKNAVLAAQAMLEAVDRLNPVVQEKNWPPLEIGIGINTDRVVAGNMGSTERLNYTVIGDGVNLAARLEGLTKRYGLPILVSQSTAEAAPDLRFRELDRVRVKGKNLPVSLYEPVDGLGETRYDGDPRDDLFSQGLKLYRQQRWVRAISCMKAFASTSPQHRTLVSLYEKRIESLDREPPPEDWDFTHTFTEK